MRVIRVSTTAVPRPRLDRLARTRPRAFAEWQALRRWNRLPPWEREVVGYLMRGLREAAGLTQSKLAERLGVTQQAVAQAERWQSNPTVELLRRWAAACSAGVEIQLGSDLADGPPAASPRTSRLSRPKALHSKRATRSGQTTPPRGRTGSRTGG